MELAGSRTEANLMAAFSGEAMARTKYDLYAEAAEKEGYRRMAEVFRQTADNERAHAEVWFKLLGKLNGTAQNLKDASDGEHYEWSEIEQEARQEGFDRIATLFRLVAGVEKEHDRRYRAELEQLQAGQAFRQGRPVRWVCMNCGYVHEGTEAPAICPLCAHPQSYYRLSPNESV